MRSMKLAALGALALLSLVGCSQGQPRLYRVAIDETPVRTIAVPSCFRNNNLPSGRGNFAESNFRSEEDWVIWNGIDQVEYLDLGSQVRKIGDAPEIRINDLIEGTDKTFKASRNEQTPISDQWTEVRQTQVTVKFNDYSAVPSGVITLTAQYACLKNRNDCPGTGNTPSDLAPPDGASCNADLAFVARRIDVQQLTAYNNNP